MQPLWQLLSAELSNVYTVNLVRDTALLLDDCILASQGMKSENLWSVFKDSWPIFKWDERVWARTHFKMCWNVKWLLHCVIVSGDLYEE